MLHTQHTQNNPNIIDKAKEYRCHLLGVLSDIESNGELYGYEVNYMLSIIDSYSLSVNMEIDTSSKKAMQDISNDLHCQEREWRYGIDSPEFKYVNLFIVNLIKYVEEIVRVEQIKKLDESIKILQKAVEVLQKKEDTSNRPDWHKRLKSGWRMLCNNSRENLESEIHKLGSVNKIQL